MGRGTVLRAGALWLFPRRQEGQVADCLRPVVCSRWLSGSGRSVRGQYRRPDDIVGANRQAQRALWPVARRAGRRPRHDHQRPHPRRVEAGRARLDHRAQSPADPRLARRGRRPAVAVRRTRSGGDHHPRVSRRAARGLQEPALGRGTGLQARGSAAGHRGGVAQAGRPDRPRQRRGPAGQDKIAGAVGRIENRYKLAKLFDLAIAEDGFTFRRNPARVADEARLDGFYVIRTSVENNVLAAHNVVGAYKSLARVERAFRSLKTVDLHLRPIHHWLAPRVRAHVFLCMLAGHVEWHMRERLKPILFDDDDPTAAAGERASIVAPAQPAPGALRRGASKLTAHGGPVHSFQSLLRDLATCTLNEMTTTLNDAYRFAELDPENETVG